MDQQVMKHIAAQYKTAVRRIICLDYDGTLVDFALTPQAAAPTPELMRVLSGLCADPKNIVMVVSGRQADDLQDWFGSLRIFLSAEHGQFMRPIGGRWFAHHDADDTWKPRVRARLEVAVQRVDKSFIEEKQTTLVWHYRQAEPANAATELVKLQADLQELGASVLLGSRVLEVSGAIGSKAAAFDYVHIDQSDFMLVAGDDITDEAMFEAAPKQAVTVKVRPGPTHARYTIATPAQMLHFLNLCLR